MTVVESPKKKVLNVKGATATAAAAPKKPLPIQSVPKTLHEQQSVQIKSDKKSAPVVISKPAFRRNGSLPL